MIVEFSDKHSLMISHDSKDTNSRNGGVTDSVKFDSGCREEQSCKSIFKNRKYIAPDNSPNILSLANDRIGVAKHDFKLYHWQITTDKGNNTGIHVISNFIKSRKKRDLKLCFNKKNLEIECHQIHKYNKKFSNLLADLANSVIINIIFKI